MDILTMRYSAHFIHNNPLNQPHGENKHSFDMNSQALNSVKRIPSLPVNNRSQPNTDVQISGTSNSGVTIRCTDDSNKPKSQPNGASSADRVAYRERAKDPLKGE